MLQLFKNMESICVASYFAKKDYRQLFIDGKTVYFPTPIPFQYFNYDMLYPNNPLDNYYYIICNISNHVG